MTHFQDWYVTDSPDTDRKVHMYVLVRNYKWILLYVSDLFHFLKILYFWRVLQESVRKFHVDFHDQVRGSYLHNLQWLTWSP